LESAAGSASSEAVELYQKGRAAISGQADPSSLKQARLYFERSIEIDPSNAGALAGLANVYVRMFVLGLGRGSEFLPRAKSAAVKAVELDSTLAEATLALAAVRFFHDHDFPAADDEFRRAIEMNPGNPVAHGWYARFLASQGRHEESVAEARRAVDVDPLSLPVRRDLLDILFMARRYEETIAGAHQLFDIAPHSADVHLGMVWIYHLMKKDREAFESFTAGLKCTGVAQPLIDQGRDAFERGGMPEIFKLWLGVLEHEAGLGQKNQCDMIFLNALLGRNDRCFELMERAIEEQHPYSLWLAVYPTLDRVRSDPRYASLISRLGLVPQPFPH
jgi:tetratricopeptide (TPR) repeat protein